jgi:non-specific serine/threonine protein kinase
VQATALTCLGVLLGNQGHLAEARRLLEAALALARGLGDLHWQAITLVMLGEVALDQPEAAQAGACWLVEGLALLQAIGDPVFTLFAIEGHADVAVRAGRPAQAARWLGATAVLREQLGARRARPNWQTWDRLVSRLRQQLGEAALAAAMAAGRGLSLEQVVAEALAEATTTQPPTPSSESVTADGRLTRREREVADLLAGGCTDREIAAKLAISVGTAGQHVHRVLAKLKVRSRWQVADRLTQTHV